VNGDILKLAVDILTDWAESRVPTPEDLQTLRRQPYRAKDLEIDELVCSIILRETKAVVRRAVTRRKRMGGA
jgi:hypothetical protein